MGAMNVGQATPYVEAFSMAKAAAGTIFAVIDRKPVIDSLSEEGMKTLKWLINTSYNFWKLFPIAPKQIMECFENKKFVDIIQQYFALLSQVNFAANNLNFHWRWRWWDGIWFIFLNIFYFIFE